MVIPDERSNSLIVVGNKAGIERVKDLLKRLDFPIKADENGEFMFITLNTVMLKKLLKP